MQAQTIAFIGAGNMSRAIISGLVQQGYDPKAIMASNPSAGKLQDLASEFSIQTTQDNNEAIAFADNIVLAVKPQLMAEVCAGFDKDLALAEKLYISVAAGIKVERLQEMLGFAAALVRTMPNTPCALGKGMTGLFASPQVNGQQKAFAQNLLAHTGETLWVDNEAMIDAVIAAAGSSPAYFFLFLEAMQAKAEELGFDKNDARLLVQQAMLGAAEMVCHNPGLELSQLRAQVTSKGGTTAKAIEHFHDQGLSEIVAGAMQAAVGRADEMSQQF